MIGKSQIKRVASLHQKKYRREFGQFIAEGPKVIAELLSSHFALSELYVVRDSGIEFPDYNLLEISDADLKKMSALSTPAGCLAVFDIPQTPLIVYSGLIVALDDIRDPGNLGTIIRLCDWFGVSQLICSEETVDVFNPKVVQSTMGSLARVDVIYTDLQKYISNSTLPVYGTFMDGLNIYDGHLPREAVIVMGNESNGVSTKISEMIQNQISIPRFGNLQKTESLNVATAAAVVLSEFRRKG